MQMNLIYIRQDIQVEFLFMVIYCYSTAVHYKPAGCQTNRNFWRNFHINSAFQLSCNLIPKTFHQ